MSPRQWKRARRIVRCRQEAERFAEDDRDRQAMFDRVEESFWRYEGERMGLR